MLEAGANLSTINKRRKGETQKQYAARAVHILLSNQSLTRIENLSVCSGSLTRLYLYDNSITQISGLEECIHLQELFLQRNRINRVEGLASLGSLRILHLAHNRITRLAPMCFSGLQSLVILHLDNQYLTEGISSTTDNADEVMDVGSEHDPVQNSLTIERDCFAGLSSLTTLTLSENHIRGLDQVALPQLESLTLAACGISCADWPAFTGLLNACTGLKNLDVGAGNAIALGAGFRRRVVRASSCALVDLDGKCIGASERACIEAMDRAQRRRKTTVKEKPGATTATKKEEEDDVVVPHLPPFATQYRDLIMHQMDVKRNKAPRAVEKGITGSKPSSFPHLM
jgi:protein phosphatase 1 regulatory subunit 42